MAITRQILEELIHEAQSARREHSARLTELEQELAALRQTELLLEREEESYRLTLRRKFPDEVVDEVDDSPRLTNGVHRALASMPTKSAERILHAPRTSAVSYAVRSLSRVQGTAGPADIEMFLKAAGREDTRDEIGGALAYLNKAGKIDRLGRGQWRPAITTDSSDVRHSAHAGAAEES